MHDLVAIAAFRKVAETKNFSTASHELRMTPSAVSRQITRLEESLGVQLLLRTTRHLRLSQTGEQFYKDCARGLVEIDRAIRKISNDGEELRGSLRIGVTPFFGKVHLVPAVLDFLAENRNVSIEVSLRHPEATFHESGIDILIRAGHVRGRSIMHEKLAPMQHMICATPSYLKKHGTPQTPKDLMRCLLSTGPKPIYEWPFSKGGRREYVPVSGNFQADSVEALYRAVITGTGIARLPNYVVGPELRAGKLLALFPQREKASRSAATYDTTTNTMKAYYLKSRYPDAKTRGFIQFLKARFTAGYNWEHRSSPL